MRGTISGMHMFMVATVAILAALMVGMGLAGIASGWVVPWARGKVLRPRLSGYGMLLGGTGFGLFEVLGPMDHAFGLLPMAGWIILMAGLGLNWLSQRPGRTS